MGKDKYSNVRYISLLWLSLEQSYVCEVCGEKNSTNFSYCRTCGAELLLMEKTLQQSRMPSTLDISNFDSTEEDLIFPDQKCWKCEKTVNPDSPFLNFCSETCSNIYSPSELQPEHVYRIYRKTKGKREYRINDMDNREFMRAISEKRGLTTFKIQDQNGLPLGEIRRGGTSSSRHNYSSDWPFDLDVLGRSEEFQVRVKRDNTLPSWGEIKTPLKTYTAKFNRKLIGVNYVIGPFNQSVRTEGNINDLDGNRYLTIVWEDWEDSQTKSLSEFKNLKWYTYRLDCYKFSSKFLTFAVSVCLIERFISNFGDLAAERKPIQDF
ncbi:MAG: hypothetical protein ACFFFG_04460 [Candidatus Thorarchaeota archaeon]